MKTIGIFAGLPLGEFGLIAADPPWEFRTYSAKGQGKSAQHHYRCMPLEEIKALPVKALAAPDCCLFMWATWPMLAQAFEVLTAWGFAYSTGGAWVKRTAGGKLAFGTGYRVRGASEPFLLGFRGSPKNSRSHRNVIEGHIREHSRKPEAAYAWMESYLPDACRLDLFSRQSRPGWTAWGAEMGKFG